METRGSNGCRSTARSGSLPRAAQQPNPLASPPVDGASPPARPRHARPSPAAQLGAAREVLPRRSLGLRRQPRCLRGAPRRCEPPLSPRRNGFVRRRGDQQLPLEPALDVSSRPRALRSSGTSLPHRLHDRLRRESRDPDSPGRGRPREDRRAGDRNRSRHAGELCREQALVVSAPLKLLAAAVAALALAPAASSATFPEKPVKAQLTKAQATALFLEDDKVADWLSRYPRKGRVTDATYEGLPSKCPAGAQGGCWTVQVWWSGKHVKAGEVAKGKVDDRTSVVKEAWTGPQVAWSMARGYEGAFGGKKINSVPVWLGLCAAFLLGLLDFRRPLSLRNLDLLALLSFSVSL